MACRTLEIGFFALAAAGLFSAHLRADQPGRLLNLSNRAFVGTGDERLIGSVRAVGEPGAQVEVLAVARGPSLAEHLPDYAGNVLADPKMTLVNLATREEATNDDFADWNNGEIESRFPDFIMDPKESGAILVLDADQAYSAIVEGVDGATGLGQIEFYEIGGNGSLTEARLGNLSNRALVGLDDERLIGSAMTTGDSPVEVLVVARGPSLAEFLPGYTGNVLSDPKITLVDLATREETANDDFADWNNGEIESRFPGFITDPKESGILVQLPAESTYSAIVEGVGEAAGIGQIEFYELQPPTAPDLIVESPGVSDDSPETGGSFTLSVTVTNQGDGESVATTLHYYRSTDATITTSDTEVGASAVDALAASGSSAESIPVTAPTTAGTWYYGACVDVVTGESNTANNCSESVQVDVEEPPPPAMPDLVVSSPSVNDDSPETGGSFTLSATVTNQGDAESAATTLRYYLSSDATITASDTEVGTDAVSALAPSGSSVMSILLTAPSTTGTWYFGACLDAVENESNTANNCSESVQVNVEEPPPPAMPDLVVSSPSVNDDNPETGESFTLSATVTNQGDGESAATTLRYYLSSDATITTSDTEVGTDTVGALAASGSSAESISLTAPSSPGTWYFGACVDAVTGESDTTDNCSASVQVDVEEPPPPPPATPDLIVESPGVSDDSPETGGSFTLSATVTNQGGAESAATTLRYYSSTDATITTSDTEVGTSAISDLTASESSPASISLTAPSTAGTWYYGACVDGVTAESNSANNCSASVKVDVEEPPPPPAGPDLIVESPGASNDSVVAEEGFSLSATVTNQGNAESAATTLRYYRSTDATITTSDTAEGTKAVGALAASGTSGQQFIWVYVPSATGTWYYGACVDMVTGESNTTNNCSASVQVVVTPRPSDGPDLVISSISVDDDSPVTGQSFTLSATVSNEGNRTAPGSTLKYYRSTDATSRSSSTFEGTDGVGALPASGTSAESISITAPSKAGTWYYYACVDSITGETKTTNNCSATVKVVVEEPPPTMFDLVVSSPSVDDDSPQTGGSFTLSATVTNTGNGDSKVTLLRYYRSTDATITTSDTEEGFSAVAVLAASGTREESISITAPSTAGTWYYGACVDAVTGESNSANNCSASVKVDVQVPPPPPPAPDLIVGSPGVTDSLPQTGGSFTLSATVTNQGNAGSTATTLRYYRSTDATITTSDTEVGTDSVAALAASGGSIESISLTAPSTAGTWYYGACVDAVTGETNTANNCSRHVKVDVQVPPS